MDTLNKIYIEILFDRRIWHCWKGYSLGIQVLDKDEITRNSEDENMENEPHMELVHAVIRFSKICI